MRTVLVAGGGLLGLRRHQPCGTGEFLAYVYVRRMPRIFQAGALFARGMAALVGKGRLMPH